MKSTYALLQHLSHDKYISGDELGRMLGVSRAAIWKMVKVCVEATGIDIYRVKGRGYSLAQPLDLLSEEAIRHHLSVSNVAGRYISNVEVISQCDSTNTQLRSRASQLESGSVLCAEQQTAGRGRNGRSWISPFGQNLYCSLYWRSNLPVAAFSGLSLALGVATVRGIVELGFQQQIRLKWPNDILYDGRKLGGFLIEMLVEANGAVGLVIGVGINVRMNEIQGKSIDQKWTDLYSIDPNISLSRNQLAATLIQRISEMLASFGELGFAAYRNEWLSLDSFFGKAVDVHLPDGIIAGIENGVDESGALCVLVDGQERKIYSGDVSLRIKDFV